MKSLPLGIAAALLAAGVATAQTNTTPATPGTTPPATTTPPPATLSPIAPAPLTPATPRAQLNPSNNSSTTPPAVTTSNAPSKTAAAPVKGRNSFSLGEARRRITRAGYTDVKGLKKDNDGIWRATATKDGQSMSVYCDYQGNVGNQ